MISNQWYAILPSKNVKVGQIVAVKRMNLDLALFRNSKGDIGCVVDQCTCPKFPSKNQQKSHGLNFDNRFITLYNNLSHLSTSTF